MKNNCLFENASFLNEKTGFYQMLNRLGNNDRFLRTWSGANNYARFAALNDRNQKEIMKRVKNKPRIEENPNTKYISKELESRIQNVVNEIMPKAKKAVTDGIESLPKEYKDNDATITQTQVLSKIEVCPSIYGDSNVSKENPAIILLYTYWFDEDAFASNNNIFATEDDEDAIENYADKNEQKIKSKLSKIDNAVMKLFSAAHIKTYQEYIEGYELALGSFIYTTLNDMKKVLDAEE